MRNACAGASLKAAGEQVGFMIDGGFTYAGAHLAAATHTFFMGDLNYRAVPPDLGHARGRKRVRNSQLQRLLSRSISTRFG